MPDALLAALRALAHKRGYMDPAIILASKPERPTRPTHYWLKDTP